MKTVKYRDNVYELNNKNKSFINIDKFGVKGCLSIPESDMLRYLLEGKAELLNQVEAKEVEVEGATFTLWVNEKGKVKDGQFDFDFNLDEIDQVLKIIKKLLTEDYQTIYINN